MSAQNLFGEVVPEPERFDLAAGGSVTLPGLRNAEEDTQIDAMRRWFYSHFQSPADETPYDSAEGGYQYLFGGPYDAKEELDAKFSDIVPEGVIEKLADELEKESWEWAGLERPGDIDFGYELDSIAPPSEHIKQFTKSVQNIRQLVQIRVDPNQQQYFLRLLFASVITALETYLSDRFISSITENPIALRKFVETYPRFQHETIKLSNVYKTYAKLEDRVKAMLLNELVWHRLYVVGKMYADTFDADFRMPEDNKELLKAIEIRHDIVHRSGKNKDYVEHIITAQQIEHLIVEADHLVGFIDSQHKKFKLPKTIAPGEIDEEIPF